MRKRKENGIKNKKNMILIIGNECRRFRTIQTKYRSRTTLYFFSFVSLFNSIKCQQVGSFNIEMYGYPLNQPRKNMVRLCGL